MGPMTARKMATSFQQSSNMPRQREPDRFKVFQGEIKRASEDEDDEPEEYDDDDDDDDDEEEEDEGNDSASMTHRSQRGTELSTRRGTMNDNDGGYNLPEETVPSSKIKQKKTSLSSLPTSKTVQFSPKHDFGGANERDRDVERKGEKGFGDHHDDHEVDAVKAELHLQKSKIVIISKAIFLLCLGAGLVLVFADSMVNAVTQLGNMLGISPYL